MSIYKGTELLAGLPDVSGKANTDMDNLSNTGKSLISGLGMPSDSYITITLNIGGSYTAPANGYLSIRSRGTSGIQYQNLRSSNSESDDSNILIQIDATSGMVSDIFYPLRKGQTVYYFGNIGSQIYKRFVYAVGEV